MPDLTIRPMIREDWPAVSRIYRQGMDTNLATFETTCPAWDAWDAAHRTDCRLVAELGESVAGWAALSPVSGRAVYAGVAEVSVYVDAGHRGLGVGIALLTRLCECAREQGVWTLQSSVFADNAASIRLHERAGFRLVGRRDRIAKDRNGTWRSTLLMEHRNDIE